MLELVKEQESLNNVMDGDIAFLKSFLNDDGAKRRIVLAFPILKSRDGKSYFNFK